MTTALAARRRHPAAIAILLVLGLFLTGAAYAAFAPRPAQAQALNTAQVEDGRKLFLANCSTCHGLQAQGRALGVDDQIAGPSLAGVGAAAVDFQVGTGRMPMRQPGAQAPAGPKVEYTREQIDALAAYVASLAPGPAIPSAEQVDPTDGDPARGGELFRTNCAMCHNAAGAGGALTRGKYAPSLKGTTPTHIYEAMLTGPQSMPVFNDQNLSPQSKRDIIAWAQTVQTQEQPGGMALGSLGPVTEGLFAWVFGLGLLLAAAIWLGSKAA